MNGSIARLLDASANRAREALRVLEDYARFIQNDAALCGQLKSIRHDFAATLTPYLVDAIIFRDVPGDVGTTISTPAETVRNDLAHIVIAAGKRLGEALRSIEEFLKTVSPPDAARIENMRYQFYDIERRIILTLRPGERFAKVRLYVLITAELCKLPWMKTVEAVLLGGADCLQLREKSLEGGELLRRARELAMVCKRHGALCIINDRADIAALADADGVHVGQGDLPAIEARKIVGNQKIVGVSTHGIEQAHAARRDGADYIGVGPVFPSTTKPRDILPGPTYARAAAAGAGIPAVAIAGISLDRLDAVLETGVQAVAVSSAIISVDDPRQAAAAFKRRL